TKRETVYGATEREVLDKKRALEDRVRRALPVGKGRSPKLAEYGDQWLNVTLRAAVTLGHMTETTRASYRDLWESHIAPDLGHLRLTELTPTILRAWLAKKRERPSSRGRPYSARTLRYFHAVLRKALNDAVRDELLDSNPMLRVQAPRGE